MSFRHVYDSFYGLIYSLFYWSGVFNLLKFDLTPKKKKRGQNVGCSLLVALVLSKDVIFAKAFIQHVRHKLRICGSPVYPILIG